MKLSCAPLSNRQVVSSPSIKASPQFLGPMKRLKGSGFKHGTGLVPSFNLPERFFKDSVGVGSPAPADRAERLIP